MEKTADPEVATLAAATAPATPRSACGAVAALRGLLEVLEALQVDNARASGWSWQQIASRLGVTKQAVHQKARPGQPPEAREVTDMVDSTRTVYFTEPAKRASTMALDEVRRLHHAYRGPEHYLLGLLRQGDSLAARVLVAHGLDLETVRAEVDRLIARGVLPGPPSDAELRRQDELQKRWLDAQGFPPENRAEVERLIAQGVIPGPDLGDAPLLATLGIDLEAVAGRLQETFGPWGA
jgi:Clp amino terminal domain, pathogenicity island component